ncbi:MAG: tetratricopeptide repeat protein, partial [Spirochaetaceae bacterium]|nr:tetratricopeptide repeat protein [Spirochaetaceae bacterium]
RGTGDCDDITVLFNTMLESVGIPTGIVTIPGHIYSAVNTGLSPRDWSRIHPDREMTLVDGDSLWVLIEITLIGQADFMDAWQTGMAEWHAYDDNEAVRNFYSTASCQEEYSPVGLQETDIGLQYGDPEEFLSGFRRDLDRLSDTILAPIQEETSRRNRPRTWNHLGVLAAQLKAYDVADDSFARAAEMDRDYLSPRVNLGALHYLQGDYDGALAAFQSAEAVIARAGSTATEDTALAVYVNLAKTLHALGSYDEAADYLTQAEGINPAEAARYSYVAGADASGGRASSAADAPAILFVDEGVE